ncbi:hypothetical protein [Streptomyces chromofuscus]|uniref:Uncharacterized protein n=1 Tax=Streptomyces chromofuscus TaxID=42881 RepID=A0A7M2TFS3_STRCW|nr:hypothetical protein [Streptomyces chromofuscus]QOV47054.1 hypothetical protein IPT68_14940 [Streptomyces chromofuscus]GGT25994.1 hypothetical protein GCM10010254_53010 [Streptomyces chromofuscus]
MRGTGLTGRADTRLELAGPVVGGVLLAAGFRSRFARRPAQPLTRPPVKWLFAPLPAQQTTTEASIR